ncbi:magnesium transporter [Campylobacter sp. RM9344]|uniref:Magnesium transporter MgtE n=1 Tax=Campylobacter californiensis TaxID=1032243 RepID=A0AAW3ZRN6_9BACT|nr:MULTISPECIES: magnesium transporter [unclassified Campylobacter]MBE2983920.1 magnesium transporter [Campylobacter sp. RM6883]MBE2986082.1 magnesium transporter [Campylobacter sp. RM12919]MBE2987495.1 magnesium transporter [Campylobacter sp. RM12920]MBE2994458.1 magnesium transporter [Campylobacter sp. RM6913]MBE3028766.1 magnesium transporter [Campylobacter sp. RM9344]
MGAELEEAKEIIDQHLNEENEKVDLTPYDLAQHLKTLKKHDEDLYNEYLEKLDPESLGDVAIELPDHMLKDVIETIPSEKIVEALEELESDDATDLLQYIEDIDEEKAKELFDGLDKEDQDEILRLRSYDENEAGAYMQTELFSANLNEKLSTAVERLREQKELGELENVSQLFITDERHILKFAIPLEDLILFDFNSSLKDIIEKSEEDKYKPHVAMDNDPIEEVVEVVQDYDMNSIAVVDTRGVLLGRITTDDIHDFIQERATEQIYNLANVGDADEEENSLLNATRSRGIWLFVNLFTAIISSSIIGLFDDAIASYVALAVLMPIVASMGGNTGTQALTVTVRRLALGEIEFKNAKPALIRELGIAFINGLIFAVLIGLVAAFWFNRPMLGVVIGTAMLTNFFFAGFFGTVIPLALKKFNIDPAVGSSVLLTTVTDVVGFFSFLGLAKWILL